MSGGLVRHENIFDGAIECRRQAKGDRKAGIVALLLERDDRQSRHSDAIRQFRLRPTQLEASASYVVLHVKQTGFGTAGARSGVCMTRKPRRVVRSAAESGRDRLG